MPTSTRMITSPSQYAHGFMNLETGTMTSSSTTMKTTSKLKPKSSSIISTPSNNAKNQLTPEKCKHPNDTRQNSNRNSNTGKKPNLHMSNVIGLTDQNETLAAKKPTSNKQSYLVNLQSEHTRLKRKQRKIGIHHEINRRKEN